MLETYFLNGDILPTIPVPHDCVIENITIENQCIIFSFEQNISYHGSIKNIKPDAESLVIKFHLTDECFSLYKWHDPIKLFADEGFYKCIDSSELFKLASMKYKLEYLYHYVAYQSLIIEMCASTTFRLELTADYMEFYWN
ncbi:MAG: hypothetical protein J6K64_04375 [Clostridia bacterium]|nr:hypothetical protein [Clostridia bacterium]